MGFVFFLSQGLCIYDPAHGDLSYGKGLGALGLMTNGAYLLSGASEDSPACSSALFPVRCTREAQKGHTQLLPRALLLPSHCKALNITLGESRHCLFILEAKKQTKTWKMKVKILAKHQVPGLRVGVECLRSEHNVLMTCPTACLVPRAGKSGNFFLPRLRLNGTSEGSPQTRSKETPERKTGDRNQFWQPRP